MQDSSNFKISSGFQLRHHPVERALHGSAHRVPAEFSDQHPAYVFFGLALAEHAGDPASYGRDIRPPFHESGAVGNGSVTGDHRLEIQFESCVGGLLSACKTAARVVVDIKREGRRSGQIHALTVTGVEAVAGSEYLVRRKVNERVAVRVAGSEMVSDNFLSTKIDANLVGKGQLRWTRPLSFDHGPVQVFSTTFLTLRGEFGVSPLWVAGAVAFVYFLSGLFRYGLT